MKRILLSIFVLCTYCICNGQINLVPNPSFEEYNHCPDMIDEAKYAYWTGLDTVWSPPDWAHAIFGAPEYCNVCSSNLAVTIPGDHTGYFYHYPRTGKGMMQVNMFYDEGYMSGGPQQMRDYLQKRLFNPLINGKKYKVTFYVSSESFSYYSVNHIGAYFDDGTIDTTHHPGWTQTQYNPQIIENAIINDTAVGDSTTWIKIQDTFTARGNEKFITIGQFTDRAHTNFIAIKDTTGGNFSSLYLVDDVSVIDCANVPFAGNDTLITAGDSVFLGPHEILLPYTWYKLGSTVAIDSGGGTMVHPAVTTTYVLEQKLCGITRWDTVTVGVAPVGVASPRPSPIERVVLFPNPCNVALTVTGAKGCEVVFYDMVGKQILKSECVERRAVINIEGLANGVYFVEVIDKETGEKVVKKILKE